MLPIDFCHMFSVFSPLSSSHFCVPQVRDKTSEYRESFLIGNIIISHNEDARMIWPREKKKRGKNCLGLELERSNWIICQNELRAQTQSATLNKGSVWTAETLVATCLFLIPSVMYKWVILAHFSQERKGAFLFFFSPKHLNVLITFYSSTLMEEASVANLKKPAGSLRKKFFFLLSFVFTPGPRTHFDMKLSTVWQGGY